MRYREKPQPAIAQRDVQTSPTKAPAEAKVNAGANETVQPERRETEVSAPAQRSAVAKNIAPVSPVRSRNTVRPQMIARQRQREMPNKVNSSQEARQQLAELVQSQKDEDTLPRLSDLIDDSN
jgi:hypothetical protein